jgi:hypothetical protein
MAVIEPQFQRDFISLLPKEVSEELFGVNGCLKLVEILLVHN